MRIKKCVKPLSITVLGNGGGPSIHIGLGWQGDVDQVIGSTDRGPVTVADGLGHFLTDGNFETVNRAGETLAAKKPATPAQE
jgi:hypothetical protein